MGLGYHAQAAVDKEIDTLWQAFKAGVDAAGDNPDTANKQDFKRHLEATNPTLAVYFDEAKLT